jgi:hypothetical protein
LLAWKGTAMRFARVKKERTVLSGVPVRISRRCADDSRREAIRALVLVCFILLALAVVAWGQGTEGEEGLDQLGRRGFEQFDRLADAARRWGRILVWVGAALLLLVALWILSPFRIYDIVSEKLLKRAMKNVDELLKRIQQEVEAANESPPDEGTEGGLLAGLTEVAEFAKAEQVPSYVLTVNDLMLDNIRITLKRLRRFNEGNAPRYRDYMFSVLQGIKTITEQSAEAGISSGLAVDVHEYFADERRFKAWRKLLVRAAKKGAHREIADTFLLFMRKIREGRPPAVSPPAAVSAPPATTASAPLQEPAIPESLKEETLPAVQQAAVREAKNLCSVVRNGRPADGACAWQFEFVRRQQQVHWRQEAQRMLSVFLSCERKALQRITMMRMLPCRTWGHVLHLLGVEDAGQMQQRVNDGLLTIQEIIIVEKAFLQTFARRESLTRVYGRGEAAGLMMDLHVPQMRREALALLRKLHQAEPGRLNDATQGLNEEETPRDNQVKRLIEHYVHHRHDPRGTVGRSTGGPEASA